MEQIKSGFFTCIGRQGHGAPAMPATREDWEQLRREPWLKWMCERIRRGDEALKNRRPWWTPHCAEYKDNHRSIADAIRPLPRLMMDFDEKGHTDEILAKLGIVDGKVTNEAALPLLPLLVEESVRGGSHVLVELPEGMTAERAQELMAEITGFTPDKVVKGVDRCIYMVPDDHTRYVSERLFEKETPSQLPLKGEGGYSQEPGQEEKEGPELSTPLPAGRGRGEGLVAQAEGLVGLLFKGVPYASIIREWWLRTGGEPQEGERNVKLHKLAVNLRAICDNKKEVLMAVMPRFGLSEAELKSIVDSACKEEPKGVSKMMQACIKDAQATLTSAETDTIDEEHAEYRSPLGGLKGGLRALPIGLRESLSGVPESMHLPVLCSVLPIAAAYADQVRVVYCDGNVHHLGLMSIIRGEQASNKSVCKMAVDVWKRQFDEEDAMARKREEEWKERKKGRKANEKAPEDPKVLIRMVPVTVSCSTLLKRFKNSCGHTLYSFGEELDTLRKTNGAGSWSSKYDIYRLSFDQGEWGQDYNSDQAESGVVKVAYNWTMLGTNGAMRKCFQSHWAKVAIEREKNGACSDSAEHEQTRPKVKTSHCPIVPSSH